MSTPVKRAAALWLIGLLTAVPYATYYLFFRASRDQYALLITFVLFWVFGYWGIVGPLLSIIKVRAVFRSIERASSREEIVRILQSEQARDVAIDHIATENGIPRFLAARVVKLLADRIGSTSTPRTEADP